MASESRGKLMSPKWEDGKTKFASAPLSLDLKKRPDGAITTKAKAAVASISKSVEAKGKSVSDSSKTTTKRATIKTKTPKKTYTLAGQKYDPPEEREPLRIFYESLSQQIPTSEMAEFWMMEHGLLSPERAKRAYEKKQRRQQQIRSGTPIKPIKLDKPESLKKLPPLKDGEPKAKRRVDYSDDDSDNDFIIKRKKMV